MRLIYRILLRHKRRSAWEVASEDTPKHDVERNRFTGETRWRPCVPFIPEGGLHPWKSGLPPAPNPLQEIEDLINEIIDAKRISSQQLATH